MTQDARPRPECSRREVATYRLAASGSVDQTWVWLPRPAGAPGANHSLLSLRAAGDLGPSGMEPEARMVRKAWLSPLIQGGTLPAPTGPEPICEILVPRQVHSQSLLFLGQDGRRVVFAGSFAADAEDRLDLAVLDLEPRLVPGSSHGPESLEGLEVDGLLTDDPSLILGVTVADCLGIVVEASVGYRPLRAALHCGWQGTGLLAVCLGALQFLASEARAVLEVQLVQGSPCIQPGDYGVDSIRAEVFARRFGPTALGRAANGQVALNLVAANQALLAGQAPCLEGWRPLPQPLVQSWCLDSTGQSPVCHSYRRDGPQAYGRMVLCTLAEPVV